MRSIGQTWTLNLMMQLHNLHTSQTLDDLPAQTCDFPQICWFILVSCRVVKKLCLHIDPRGCHMAETPAVLLNDSADMMMGHGPSPYTRTGISIRVQIYIYIYIQYACMYVCMYVCVYACMYLSIYLSIYLCIYVSMYLCIYVCMHACMYECMDNHIHIHTRIIIVRERECIYIYIYVCLYIYI